MASINYRNGSYQITVSLGRDVTGKQIRKTITYRPDLSLLKKKTPAARENELKNMVETFAADFERKCRSGNDPDGRLLSLKDFSEQWLQSYAETNLQPTTLQNYIIILNKHILPALGHLKLTEIRPANITAFYSALARDGARIDGKDGGYSLGTIKKISAVLSSILSTADKWEIIPRNPCEKASLPTNIESSNSLKFFSPEQAQTFLAYLDLPYEVHYSGHVRNKGTDKEFSVPDYNATLTVPLQIKVLMHLGINSGARKGELLALQWQDINFEECTLSITKSVAVVNNKQIVKAPKTQSSYRTIYVSQHIIDMLSELREEQKYKKAERKDYWKDEGWIFTQDDGSCMNYSTPYQALQQILDRYNKGKPESEQLPYIPFHGLRHTSATAQIANGVDVVTVANRLGHSSTNITTNTYAHPLSKNDRDAANALDDIFKVPAKKTS